MEGHPPTPVAQRNAAPASWMRPVGTAVAAVALLVTVTGGNCSRERVESMTRMNEGVLLAQQKRYVEAIEQLERAAALDATNDAAHYNLAIVHIETRKFDRAREDLTRAIAINPNVAGYHDKLGTVLMELGRWEEARAALEKAVELDPQLFKAYYRLAQCAERLDDPQTALRRYTDAIQHGPRFLEAYAQLGRLYADLGFLDEAVTTLQSARQVALEGTEELAAIHHLLGTVYQQRRQFEQAIQEFRAALDISPGMAEALFSLGWTYGLSNQRAEAIRYLRKYLEVAADAPPHYVKAARDRISELEAL
ncbi:MAG: tetratricopeptide repeat protein [Myxococcota bacterium]|nr:tetratricopeptide repeat protein [Myxococcota bacterium]MDW8360886.1 tetratricopeptide repeat protein [Myxococcales bacterium]